MSDCGCEKDEFANLATVEDEAVTDAAPDPRGTTVRVFRDQLIAPYNKPTGDKRRFKTDALSSRALPLPVKWQRADNQGHSSSVGVGRLDAIRYGDGPEGTGVYGSGIIFSPDPEVTPRWAEDCAEAYGLLQEKVIGPSVDLDDLDFHEYEGDDAEETPDEFAQGERPEIEVTRGRISAVTLVQIPAFAEARPFAVGEQDADEYAILQDALTALTAAGVYVHDETMPVAADAEWDMGHWLEHAIDIEGAALYDGPDAVAPYFPVADVVDGQLALIPGAIADAISVMAFKADQVEIPEGAKQCIRARLEDLAVMADLPMPPWVEQELSLVAAGSIQDWLPDRGAFENPNLDGPTPITVRDGKVFGHLATWKACHIGYRDCRRAPRSRSNYAHFHVGEIQTTDGPLAVGKITLGGGHADTRLGFQAAAEHYDDAGSSVAAVRAGEDRHGIWIAGVALPGAEDKFATLPLYPLSGDWRRIGGHMEMIAALAVNTPGFGITRVHTNNVGQELTLVAAGMLEEYKMISSEVRKKAAQAGHANPDGSYPIETVSDLENAIQAYGRAKNKPQTRALIMRRARELHREDLIPQPWRGSNADAYAMFSTDEEILEAVRLEWAAEIAAEAFGDETLVADAAFEGKHTRGFHGMFIRKLLGHHMGDGGDAGTGGSTKEILARTRANQEHVRKMLGMSEADTSGLSTKEIMARTRANLDAISKGHATPANVERMTHDQLTREATRHPHGHPSRHHAEMELARRHTVRQQADFPNILDENNAADNARRKQNLKRLAELQRQLEGDQGLNDQEQQELDRLRRLYKPTKQDLAAREKRLNNPGNFADADEAIKTYRAEHETMRLARIVADGLDELDEAHTAAAALSASTAF